MALGDRISRIVRANCNDLTGKLEPVEGAGFIATGAATGAGVSATVGGMGLVGGFGGVGIGMAPVAAAGAVVGLGAYGLNRLLDEAKTTENPEKVLESLKQIKLNIQQEIASLTASKKLIQQKHSWAQHEVSSWHQVAEAAMKQGREDLARKALERKLSHQQNATTLKTQLEQVTARIEALRGELSVIERTIAEV